MWLPMTRRLRGVCDRGAGRFGGSRVDGESPKKDIGDSGSGTSSSAKIR